MYGLGVSLFQISVLYCFQRRFLHSADYKSEFQCRIHKDSQIISILNRTNPIPRIDTFFFKPILILSSHLCYQFLKLELIYYFTYFSTVVPSHICVFLFCRPFVINTTFSTGLVGVEVSSVSWLRQLTVPQDMLKMLY